MLQVATLLSHSVVLVTTAIACLTYEHSSVYERPTQSSVVILALSGHAILLFHALFPQAFSSVATSAKSAALPLRSDRRSNESKSIISSVLNPWRAIQGLHFQLRRQLVIVALAICLTVEAFRFVLNDRQCIYIDTLGWVPFTLVWYHRYRRRKDLVQDNTEGRGLSPSTHFLRTLDGSSFFWSATGLGLASTLASIVFDRPRSTYICAASSTTYRMAIPLQIASMQLASFLFQAASNLVGNARSASSADKSSPEMAGYLLITSSTALLLGGTVGFITHPMHWQWVFNFDQFYILSLCWHILLFTAFVLAAVHVSLEYGTMHLVMFLTFTCTYVSRILYAGGEHGVLSPTDLKSQGLSVLTLFTCSALYLYSGGAGPWERPKRSGFKTPRFAYAALLAMMIFLSWFMKENSLVLDDHPITSLMKNASIYSEHWALQASKSQTLEDATDEYRRRYGRPPPPGFNTWYKFATERSTLIIDDYDSIYEDLRPFWAISPAEVRLRTQEVLSNTWNEVAEIRIRNGKADLGDNFKPTHRWMLDGILSMISDFSLFLPDMDLAFNLNDEPRVAVPFATMQRLEDVIKSQTSTTTIRHRWSPDRAKTWSAPKQVAPSRPFGSHPRINSFTSATVACPPNSAARRHHIWNPRPLYTSSFAPHSLGPFISDWTLSASPCHQPDLRNLHGFYLSPAAFKTTHTLLPIFSQSKVAGFADILYPSPWNYIDKAAYSPTNTSHPDAPFPQKASTFFWRGGTSEGVSRFGTWKGMARQRFVNLVTNPSPATSPLLTPHPSRPGKYTFTSTAKLPQFLIDVGIVGEFARAWDSDGAQQAAQFPLVAGVDFQAHWQHRYLFDTDGAGFSGRFLPFLHSRSLPFRAGIFRAWFDARLTAWRHFVPVDVRLHGLVATLQFFAGSRETEGEGGDAVAGETAAGEEIAEAGREWAGRVLRKEDMEVYMFRLLLEWGRVTDERREEIGFVVENGAEAGTGTGTGT